MKSLSIMFITLVISVLLLSQCVEEPTLSPVKRAYSAIRVGNLTNNVEKIDLYIDDVLFANDVEQGKFTTYKDHASSPSISLYILDALSGDTLFNNPNQNIAHYAEIGFFLSGFYSIIEDDNTISFDRRLEGFTYLRETSGADSLRYYAFSGIRTEPGDTASNILTVAVLQSDPVRNIDIDSLGISGAASKTVGKGMPAGDYKLILSKTDASIIDTIDVTFSGDMRYYLYLRGQMSNPVITQESLEPPVARDK